VTDGCGGAGEPSAAGLGGTEARPCSSIASLVSVPVLSKQQTSTLPAKGMRKGSVQKTERRRSARRLALTAIVSSIGSSGGMTEVTTIAQFR
jgi:hypothetical protein